MALLRCESMPVTPEASGESSATGPAAISLDASSHVIMMAPGTLSSVTAFVTRTGGFRGSVTLTAHGTPEAIHVQFGRRVIEAQHNATAVNLNLIGEAPAGVYPLVIVARGAGVEEQRLLVEVVISAARETDRQRVRPPGRAALSLAMHTEVPSSGQYHGRQPASGL